jgi:hypothetical protein
MRTHREDYPAPDVRRESAERAEKMLAIGSIYRRWEEGAVSTPTAIEKVREILEPVVVRVGGPQHNPEVRT